MMFCATKLRTPIGEFKALIFCEPQDVEKLTKYLKDTYKADVKFGPSPFELEDVDYAY